jgi:hypothetical protein
VSRVVRVRALGGSGGEKRCGVRVRVAEPVDQASSLARVALALELFLSGSFWWWWWGWGGRVSGENLRVFRAKPGDGNPLPSAAQQPDVGEGWGCRGGGSSTVRFDWRCSFLDWTNIG